ncbi:MAG: hypothetical protein GC147_07910 [Porphyrobacter sp.]|nr:hypothetical protein [Porphyrobacter sp.]
MNLRASIAASLALAAALVPPGSALAAQASTEDAVTGFQSAGDLLRKCRENSSYSRSYCFAYLAAVADAARAYHVWLGEGDPCLPGKLTLGRLADIFEEYLIANPTLTEAQAASVIVSGLQERFPCPASTPDTAPDLPGRGSVETAPDQVDPAP